MMEDLIVKDGFSVRLCRKTKEDKMYEKIEGPDGHNKNILKYLNTVEKFFIN